MRITLLAPALLLAACQSAGPVAPPSDVPPPVNPIATPPPPSTPPPPMPPAPPDASWLLATPEPALTTTGETQVDAYRQRLIDESGFGWGPILTRLLAGIRADPAIVADYDRMRAIDTPAEYVAHYVTPERIAAGRAIYNRIGRIGTATDGAPLELKVALWGALSDYGARKPEYDLLQVMLVLGAHGRLRLETAFPIHEAAMLIVEHKVDRPKLRGYDSGRLGDIQYSPDVYTRLARDGDGDGFADVWDNRRDILANLEVPDREEPRMLVIAVKPERFDRNDPGQARLLRAMEGQRVTATYFRRFDGRHWPAEAARWAGAYDEPFGKDGPAFLLMAAAGPVAYRDPYRDAYEGNEKRGFALAVGLLAEAIAGRPIPEMAEMR